MPRGLKVKGETRLSFILYVLTDAAFATFQLDYRREKKKELGLRDTTLMWDAGQQIGSRVLGRHACLIEQD